MAYGIYMSRSNLLTWTQLLIAVLAVFTLLGDRISKLVIGLKGVSIEQQVEAFKSDINKIEAISTIGHPVELVHLLRSSYPPFFAYNCYRVYKSLNRTVA